MGFLARITTAAKSSDTKTNFSSLFSGGHAIDKEQVLSPTDATVINPVNPGSWQSIRTAPINTEPRYYTKAEADALKKLATQKRLEARQSQRAYKSLNKLELSDAQVHTSHRKYIKGVADSELTKKRSDVSTAKHLHTLRPDYARLGSGLDCSENKAQQRIDELKAKIQEKY